MNSSDKDIFARNILYWGVDNQKKLTNLHVAVFGLGGVGGFCVEALARAGVGELTIIDFDEVSHSNINRQIVAMHSTVEQNKARLFEQRLQDINPDIKLHVIDDFYTEGWDMPQFDFVADAIDTMRSKIALLETCIKKGIPVVSSMGAGNRINPTELYICDISEIQEKNAPFISNILYQLKKRGIEKGVRVVTSHEKPFVQEKISNVENIRTKSGEEIEFTKITPASTPFVASCAGIFMAYYIVNQIVGDVK